MRRTLLLVLPIAIAVGGWQFLQRYQIEGLERLQLKPRGANSAGASADDFEPAAAARSRETVRIASFNLAPLTIQKLRPPGMAKILVDIARRFDVLAIQGIRPGTVDVMSQFVELLNRSGAKYDYLLSGPRGRTAAKEQFAFLYNTATLEVDRESGYTVADPDDLLQFEPLVGVFRVRGLPAEEALTFTLVNVRIDPQATQQELNELGNVFRAVRDDGQHEDDLIILGDLNADDRQLQQNVHIPYMTCALSGISTVTRGGRLADNLLFDQRGMTEYTGQAGVIDLVQEFGLSMAEAVQISEHLPIWADFNVREDGEPKRMASPAATVR